MKFQLNLIINNIYELTKQRNISIGKLEKEIDVSPGYFSRLKNNNKSTVPGIDILISIAEKLSISLDTLCFTDCTRNNLSNDETKLINFINLIIKLTNKDNLKWELISLDRIRSSLNVNSLNDDMKLFISIDSSCPNISTIKYNSLFIDDSIECNLEMGILSFDFKKSKYYLNMVSTFINNTKQYYYEFYLYLDNKLRKVCTSYENEIPLLITSLSNLYTNALNNATHIKLNKDVENEIDNFINSNTRKLRRVK